MHYKFIPNEALDDCKIAICKNNLKLFKLLLKYYVEKEDIQPLLTLAVRYGRFDMLKILIEEIGAEIATPQPSHKFDLSLLDESLIKCYCHSKKFVNTVPASLEEYQQIAQYLLAHDAQAVKTKGWEHLAYVTAH